jgi:RNA polymerase sigma factor (sigma-70 family)
MDKENRFKEAIGSNKQRIYRLCCCYVSQEDERKDVYQEVLIYIWRSLDKFEGRSDISTWIYRITINTCLGYLRSEKRRKRVFDDASRFDRVDIPDQSLDGDALQTETKVERLYDCIADLPAIDRTLVSLYLEDLSTGKMAEILGISEVNVRVKMHRIKKALKEKWEAAEDGSE